MKINIKKLSKLGLVAALTVTVSVSAEYHNSTSTADLMHKNHEMKYEMKKEFMNKKHNIIDSIKKDRKEHREEIKDMIKKERDNFKKDIMNATSSEAKKEMRKDFKNNIKFKKHINIGSEISILIDKNVALIQNRIDFIKKSGQDTTKIEADLANFKAKALTLKTEIDAYKTTLASSAASTTESDIKSKMTEFKTKLQALRKEMQTYRSNMSITKPWIKSATSTASTTR